MQTQMPMCPFCNRETTYVVPNSDGTFHCMNCGGDFDKNGNPTVYPDSDDDDGDVFVKASDLEWVPSKKKGFARRRYGR